MLNDLLLLSGNDIPLKEAKLIIHQPTLKEIAYIGEDNFYLGCEFLTFSRNRLSSEDMARTKGQDEFLLFMTLLTSPNQELKQSINAAIMLLTLMFPNYSLSLAADKIIFTAADGKDQYLDTKSFSSFKQTLSAMFCLVQSGLEATYNPAKGMAEKIADKLKKRQATLAKIKNKGKDKQSKISILSRYVSILTIGTQKDLNSYMNYTVYQLFDEFRRFELKMQYDINFQARMAGAKDLPEIEDWMKDIHS